MKHTTSYMSHVSSKKGAAILIAVLLFLSVSLIVVLGIATPILKQVKITKDLIKSKQSYYLAAGGLEDALYRVKNVMDFATGETIVVDGYTTTLTMVTGYNTRTLTASSDRNGIHRVMEAEVVAGEGVAFGYGVQVGAGGIDFDNSSGITGSVYSNGPIDGASGATISGSAYSAGASGSISSVTVGTGSSGVAHAHTVTNSTINGTLYCATGSGNNKSCNTSQPDPSSEEFPISDDQINNWKASAEEGGVTTGNYTVTSDTSLGPKKITGNLIINSNVTLTLTGTIWVQGSVTLSNGAIVRLASSYTSNGGVLVTDGKITLSNNATFQGSGQTGSYLLAITTSDCPHGPVCTSGYAISVSNNAGTAVLNAQKGTVFFSNNAGAKEAVAYRIVLDNNATIVYESGLANVNFTNGPSGGWNINRWQEVE